MGVSPAGGGGQCAGCVGAVLRHCDTLPYPGPQPQLALPGGVPDGGHLLHHAAHPHTYITHLYCCQANSLIIKEVSLLKGGSKTIAFAESGGMNLPLHCIEWDHGDLACKL